MKVLKKWGILFVSLFFIAAIVILALFSKNSIDKLNNAIEERDYQISVLEDDIDEIGPMTTGYVLNTDVRSGEIIDTSYFDEVSVPEKLIMGLVTDLSDLDGCYFRTSLKSGTVLTTEDVNYHEVLDSERYVDIVLDSLPIGIAEGDIIDIRISFPYGESFIALSGKKIETLVNSTMITLILNENEIAIYNSMLLDRILYSGTEIIAYKYVDAGSQETAEAFYPINQNQSDLLIENPNALELSKQEMILKRQLVEASLSPNGLTTTDGMTEEEISAKLESIQDQIQSIRESTQDRISSANEVIIERREEEAERAAEAAAEAAAAAEGY